MAAILDPDLTLGLPPALTAATGMDAIRLNAQAESVRREDYRELLAQSI